MKKKMIFTFLFILLSVTSIGYCVFDSAGFGSEKPLEIRRIAPAGEDVLVGRQIVIQFNRPVGSCRTHVANT